MQLDGLKGELKTGYLKLINASASSAAYVFFPTALFVFDKRTMQRECLKACWNKRALCWSMKWLSIPGTRTPWAFDGRFCSCTIRHLSEGKVRVVSWSTLNGDLSPVAGKPDKCTCYTWTNSKVELGMRWEWGPRALLSPEDSWCSWQVPTIFCNRFVISWFLLDFLTGKQTSWKFKKLVFVHV